MHYYICNVIFRDAVQLNRDYFNHPEHTILITSKYRRKKIDENLKLTKKWTSKKKTKCEETTQNGEMTKKLK